MTAAEHAPIPFNGPRTNPTDLLPFYRRWRRAMRTGRDLCNEADRRCGELTVPPALVRLPDYAGGGVVGRADTIRECGRLTDEDRAALLAEFERLETAVLEAEKAAGITDLSDEAHRLWLEESALASQILAAPAHTLPDLHAKAQVGLAYSESWTPNSDPEKALFAIARDLGAQIQTDRSRTARELLWWALLHCAEGWVYSADETSVSLDINGGPKGLVVPVLAGDEILPDTTSPLWPAALAELQAARARGAYPLQRGEAA